MRLLFFILFLDLTLSYVPIAALSVSHKQRHETLIVAAEEGSRSRHNFHQLLSVGKFESLLECL